LLSVWFAAKNKILNWPLGFVSAILYFFVFNQSHLFSDAVLQLFFAFFQIYGWLNWKKKADKIEKPIANSPQKISIILAIIIFISTIIWQYILIKIKPNASLPLADSFTTCVSLAAIYMQAKRYIQNWLLWILADAIYVPMYLYKLLNVTAILYFILLLMAIWGWQKWRMEIKIRLD
jgi:nicotinamide mononucleotide transporter